MLEITIKIQAWHHFVFVELDTQWRLQNKVQQKPVGKKPGFKEGVGLKLASYAPSIQEPV